MPVTKKNLPSKKKASTRRITKKQSGRTSFQEKIDKANKLLSETVFIKKPVQTS